MGVVRTRVVNYHAYKMRQRAPQNASSVDKAKRMGLQMFDNVYKHIGRTRQQIAASLDSAQRDKGHILVDAGASIDSKYRNFIQNNTGANLQMPEEAPQNIVSKVRNKAIQALTSKPAQQVRDFMTIDPAGENVDRTQAVLSGVARYAVPVTGAGVGLLGLTSMYGGPADQQTSGQIGMSEEERRKKEEETNLWAAAALATGALGGGGILGYNARPRV